MTKEIIPLGIPAFDNIVNGIPRGSVLVVLSNYHNLRKLVSKSFVMGNEDRTIIITTRTLPRDYDVNDERIVFVDAISWRYQRVNPSKERKNSKYHVQNLSDLNNLLAKTIQACKENENVDRMVFDTPSNLLLYSTPGKEQVIRFIELLSTYTRSHGITLILLMQPNIHNSTIISTFQFLGDGSIELTLENNTKKIRVIEMLDRDIDTSWIDL